MEDLGIVLAAAGKLEAGAFSLVGLLNSEDGRERNFGGVVVLFGVADSGEADTEF